MNKPDLLIGLLFPQNNLRIPVTSGIEFLLHVLQTGLHIILPERRSTIAEILVLPSRQGIEFRKHLRILVAQNLHLAKPQLLTFFDDKHDAIRALDPRFHHHLLVAVVAKNLGDKECGIIRPPWSCGLGADVFEPPAHELENLAFALAFHSPDVDLRLRNRRKRNGKPDGRGMAKTLHLNLSLHIARTLWSPSAPSPAERDHFSLSSSVAEVYESES